MTYNEKKHFLDYFYLRFIQGNVVYRFLPELIAAPFRYHYQLFKPVFKKTFPWTFLKEGDTAIQVGCSKASLGKGGPHPRYGLSQPLVMSAIVGEKGRVYVLEPVKENIRALKDYIKKNKIANITVIPKGVWKEKGVLRFFVNQDQPSENVILQKYTPEQLKSYQRRYKHNIEEFEVDALDNIVREHKITKPDFVNITINTAEFEAICGMKNLLQTNIAVSFPIQTAQTFNSPILKTLDEKGFNIHIENAPVSVGLSQFMVAVAYKSPVGLPVSSFEAELLPRHHIVVVPKNPKNSWKRRTKNYLKRLGRAKS
jgi:FkbM family methyltransferase